MILTEIKKQEAEFLKRKRALEEVQRKSKIKPKKLTKSPESVAITKRSS